MKIRKLELERKERWLYKAFQMLNVIRRVDIKSYFLFYYRDRWYRVLRATRSNRKPWIRIILEYNDDRESVEAGNLVLIVPTTMSARTWEGIYSSGSSQKRLFGETKDHSE